MRILAVALVALLLSLPVTADAGVSVARKAAQALRIAKIADKRSRRALAIVRAPSQGIPGAPGPRGSAGTNGPIGPAGVPGKDGKDGANGATSLPIVTASNLDAVEVPGGGSRVDVVSLVVDRPHAGSAYVTVEGQMNGENGVTDWAACVLHSADVVAERVVTAHPNSQAVMTASTVVNLPAGASTLAFTCRKGSDLSVVSFPAERTRMTVVG